jgi:pimeloyl-ACP methyl ester carboxylesterase
MRERALRFGSSSNLVGILSEPPAGTDNAGRPAVLFLNSGILHRAGASRLYVQIARHLAEEGFTSLRFDFSGIGDSEPRKDTLPFARSAVVESREAMDYLAAARGFNEFIIIGLCSGADMGFWVSLEDPRVVGLAQLDAFAYRTFGFMLRHYAPRIVNPAHWVDVVQGRIRNARIARERSSEENSVYIAPEYRRQFPPRERVEEGLKQLMDRNVQLFYFFSGGLGEHLNHRGQYVRAFPAVDFGNKVQVEYIPEADHIVTSLGHQRFVVRAIGEWAGRCFAARANPLMVAI